MFSGGIGSGLVTAVAQVASLAPGLVHAVSLAEKMNKDKHTKTNTQRQEIPLWRSVLRI